MPIVIDANALTSVFSAAPDEDFVPVKDWVFQDGVKIVIGGTKYKEELSRVIPVLNMVKELSRAGKVIRADSRDVDRLQEVVESVVPAACDDPHLIALIGISRCPVICTKDVRAHPFLKNKTLYPWKNFAPSIYSGRKSTDVLSRKNAEAKCFTKADENPNYQEFVNRTTRK